MSAPVSHRLRIVPQVQPDSARESLLRIVEALEGINANLGRVLERLEKDAAVFDEMVRRGHGLGA